MVIVTGEYLESEKIEIYTTEWIDITDYVLEDIDSKWGIQGETPADRVSSTGEFKIILNNVNGLFSPNTTTVLTGFKKKIPIRYTVVYDSSPFVKFYGKIESINADSGEYDGKQRTTVKALDWMDVLSRHKLTGFGIETEKTIDQAVQTILADITVAPLTTTYYVGENVFPTVFDDIKDGTKALTEISKLTMSEMGWAYLKRNKTTGEEFIVESKTTRDARDISTVPIAKKSAGFFKLNTGDYLLRNNNEKLVLSKREQFIFDNTVTNVESEFGSGILNDIEFIAYPRRVDTSVKVLYSTSERIELPAGITKDGMKVQYKDPSGGNVEVNADPDTMIVPLSGTDFTMTSNKDGTGTDLTSNLILVVTYGIDGVNFSIQNTGATDGWVYLQFRGYGIYIQDPITYRAYDPDSIEEYGYKTLSITQKYLAEPYLSAGIANVLLNSSLEPKTDVTSISFIANLSEQTMFAFLYLDIGSKIYLRESKTGVDAELYIQNIKFKVTVDGIIFVDYGIVPAISMNPVSWLVEVDGRSELNQTTIVGF